MADLQDIPSQSEYVQWRTAVLAMANPQGQKIWTPAQFNSAVGALVGDRTWETINEELRLFLASAPAGPSAQPSSNGNGNGNS
jgi:hypothetical protein